MVDTCARGRWHGSLHELVEDFQPEVTCVKFVTYRKVVAPPEGRNRASPLRDIPQILGHRLLFRRLRALLDKLCFRDTAVTAALKIISEQRVWFYENPGHRDAWSTDLSAMVRSMLQDIRQAMISRNRGSWRTCLKFKAQTLWGARQIISFDSISSWAPLGARALAHHLSKLSRCKCQRTLEVGALWSECGAMAGDMNLPTSVWTNTNGDAP